MKCAFQGINKKLGDVDFLTLEDAFNIDWKYYQLLYKGEEKWSEEL
jgi:hypothetical protein